MLNQTVLVGRLIKNPEIKVTNSGKKVTNITLAVPRTYKNSKGEYDTDFIDCVLWSGIAESTSEYCSKGNLLGIKGRINTSTYTKGDEVRYKTEIVAEKVTFLSNKNQQIKGKEE
ncbi:MAG: single-stranded DNA-binding protein [Bacilli bacterium]